MKTNSLVITNLIMLIVLALFCIIFKHMPNKSYQIVDSFSRVPKVIAGYKHHKDIIMDDLTMKALGADAVLYREYINAENDIIHLVMVFHKNERWGAHTPEGCYESQGWSLEKEKEKHHISIKGNTLSINKLVINNLNRRDIVYYWYFDDTVQTANRLLQWGNQFKKAIYKDSSGYGMVRISKTYQEEKDEIRIRKFISETALIIPSIFKKK